MVHLVFVHFIKHFISKEKKKRTANKYGTLVNDVHIWVFGEKSTDICIFEMFQTWRWFSGCIGSG